MIVEFDGFRITDFDNYLRTLEVQIDAKSKELEVLKDRRGLILATKAAAAKQAAKKKDGKR